MTCQANNSLISDNLAAQVTMQLLWCTIGEGRGWKMGRLSRMELVEGLHCRSCLELVPEVERFP
jgi:hypothetical protein